MMCFPPAVGNGPTGRAWSADRGDSRSSESGYRETTLENGIRVVTESLPQAPSVSIGVLVDVCPRNETRGQAGLAHLTEHLLFQGTSNRDVRQIAHLMDLVGGNVGGFTTRDYTCYWATVLDEHYPYALELFGDLLLNSIFPEERLEKEKQAILHEIDGVRDSPANWANDLLKTLHWPEHPLGRSVLGRVEAIARCSREDLIYFFHSSYVPDALIVTAAGNLVHEDFTAQVGDACWRMLGKRQARAVAPPQPHSGVRIAYRPVTQAYFCLGIPACPYAHPLRYGVHCLTNLLGGGISSRLHRRLREEEGLVYHISAEYHAYRDAGVVVVEGSTSPECLLGVLSRILLEVGGLARWEKPVEEEELWRAKKQLRSQHLLGTESTHTRMSRLLMQDFYFGHPIASHEVLEHIAGADGEQLQRVAQEWLRAGLGCPAVVVVGPEAPRYYDEDTVASLLADFR
jgi:predicted Zn-dependent peptidase